MTMQVNLALALTRLTTAINAVDTHVGPLASLSTTNKTSLVAALNEVQGLIPTVASFLDDNALSTAKSWSSSKINSQITAAIQALLGGASGNSDTLKELADQITALAQADNGLLSFAAVQTLTVGQKQTGCGNLGIGDPTHNYVTAIEAALNVGL